MKKHDGKSDCDAHTHADFTDQVDLGGHLAGHFLLVGAALHFQEVIIETDFLAIVRHNLYAKRSDNARLAHQIDVNAHGDDAIEGVLVLQQGHGKQVLIFQFSADQLLHGIHQRIGSFLIIEIFGCGAVGIDDFLQCSLRLVEDVVHAITGGRLELQAHGSLGPEQNGHIEPQESTVHIDVQGQLLLKVQIGSQGNQQSLGTVQVNRNTHADAGGDRTALGVQHDVQLGIADIGYQGSKRIGVRTVLLVQQLLGFLAGHDGYHHLGLQLIVGSKLTCDGLFNLGELLPGQVLLHVHFLGGVNIQLGNVFLGVRIAEGHLGGAVVKLLHRQNFRKEHVTRQIAALPGVDRGFIPIDFAVVEYDNLLRLEINLTGHNQLAGNDISLGFVILHNVMYGAVRSNIACVLNSRLVHGGVISHVIPQSVGQTLGKLNNLDLLTEYAHRQRIDILRIAGKLHAVLYIQGEGGAGGEARLTVNFNAASGFAHGDFGSLQAGAGFHGDIVQSFGCGHTLRQHQADGCRAVGKLNFGDRAGVFPHLLLIGGIHGIEGHALLDGIGIAKGGSALLVRTPTDKGIAFLGSVQALHRLGQQILTLGEHHLLQLTAAEGFEGDDGRISLINKPGVQGHLLVHRTQPGDGLGIGGVFIPGGEDLALQGGDGLGEIDHAAGSDFLGFNARTLGNEGHQPLAQDKIHLLAGLQLHDLGIGAGHFKRLLRLIDDGAGGTDGQRARSLLHTNHAQRAAALDKYFVGTLDDHLGKLRAGIHMEVDHVGLCFFTRLHFLFHRSIMDMYTGDLALAQIDAAFGIQGKCIGLDSGQGQPLGRRNCKALRQHRGDGKVVAQDSDVTQTDTLQAVNGFLRIDHSRERNFHQLHVFIHSDDSGRINLRRFLGQISFLCEDGQIDTVILQAQICDTLRICVKINICRVFDNIAQHTSNLFAGFRPRDLLGKGKHIAGGLPLYACRFCEARKANVGDNGDRQDHGNNSSEICPHFYPPAVNNQLHLLFCNQICFFWRSPASQTLMKADAYDVPRFLFDQIRA